MKNREKIRERTRKWRKENSKKIAEKTRKYRKDNREKIREQSSARYQKLRMLNPEKIRERGRKYRAGHSQQVLEQGRKWRRNNSEKSKAYSRKYKKNNPEKVIETLMRAETLPDTAEAYADYDYRMHHELAFACGNPIYVLTLNGFKGFYARIARHYFADERTRHLAQTFFNDLKQLAEENKFDESIVLIRKYGLKSGELWQEIRETLPADIMEQDA